MKKSKYLGMKSGDWQCTHVGVAYVQPAFKQKPNEAGKRERSKYPGHQQYYYVFERLTSDLKALKAVRLTARQANQILKGWATVEEYADKKAQLRPTKFAHRVSYSFCD